MWRKLCFILVVFCIAGPGSAAEIELFNIPGEIALVSIKGEIVDGDADRFQDLVRGHTRISVLLNSPGGLVREALGIGAQIRLNNYATVVLPEGNCFSACGLVWVAGSRRYISASSKIGFHAAYSKENGEYITSGVANAEIGSYLTHLGLRIEAIRYFTLAGPKDFLLLTPELARALGIEIFEQEGRNVTTPTQAPTVDTYADRFVSYGVLRSRCEGFLRMDQHEVVREQLKTIQVGQQLAGNTVWIGVWTPMLEEAKAGLSKKGPLTVCLETEAHLRSAGLPTGVNGPSFDCQKAHTSTENALCSHPRLWAKDRAMNSIYLFIRGGSNVKLRKALLENQRLWLRTRDACGSNVACLHQSYDSRFQVMKDIDVSAPAIVNKH